MTKVKKFLMVFVLLLIVVPSIVALAGCNKSKQVEEEVTTETYTVTFVGHDDALISTVTVAKGGTVTPPETPARTGYTFVGWFSGSTKLEDMTISSDITVKAKYTINYYAVIFMDDLGNVIQVNGQDAQSIPYGFSATAPSAPAKEGYIFVRWSSDYTSITANTVITAVYEEYIVPISGVWTLNSGSLMSGAANLYLGDGGDDYFNEDTILITAYSNGEFTFNSSSSFGGMNFSGTWILSQGVYTFTTSIEYVTTAGGLSSSQVADLTAFRGHIDENGLLILDDFTLNLENSSRDLYIEQYYGNSAIWRLEQTRDIDSIVGLWYIEDYPVSDTKGPSIVFYANGTARGYIYVVDKWERFIGNWTKEGSTYTISGYLEEMHMYIDDDSTEITLVVTYDENAGTCSIVLDTVTYTLLPEIADVWTVYEYDIETKALGETLSTNLTFASDGIISGTFDDEPVIGTWTKANLYINPFTIVIDGETYEGQLHFGEREMNGNYLILCINRGTVETPVYQYYKLMKTA